MFSSIVVPLDLGVLGDRALPIAQSLAEVGGLPIELLTITSPGMDGFRDAWHLEQRAKSYGIGAHANHVLYDDDAAHAIAEHLRRHRDALVVMASTAKGPLRELLFGSVSEHVLTDVRRPVLIVGPHADVSVADVAPTLVLCVDDAASAEAALPAIVTWHQTFGGRAVRLVEVMPLAVTVGGGNGPAEPDVDRVAHRLADHGIEASCQTLNGGDPVTRLNDYILDVPNAVLVATSRHWTGSRTHWHSATRALARRSPRPVLVVPAA